jgi:hypothetical protein
MSELKLPRTITINVRNWAYGESDCELYNKSIGKYCALGILLSESGIDDDDLNGQSLPSDVANDTGLYNSKLCIINKDLIKDTKITLDIINTNDDVSLTLPIRIQKLTKLFHKLGIKLKVF